MSFRFLRSDAGGPPILVPAIGLELHVRPPPEASGGALTIIETINGPGCGPPLHRHRETEVFRVIAGRYLFEVNGERFRAAEGDVVGVPGGSAHSFVNVTDRPAGQFVLILPGTDAAAFLTGLGVVMTGEKPDQEALATFGKPWGVEFLGPPLKPA